MDRAIAEGRLTVRTMPAEERALSGAHSDSRDQGARRIPSPRARVLARPTPDALQSTFPHDRITDGIECQEEDHLARLTRESTVSERRARKQAKKGARKQDGARQQAGPNDTAGDVT